MSYLGFLTTRRLIPDHSFHCIQTTSSKRNGHKSRCTERISGTKALQFVTFWKFLSLTENAGEHRSKGIDHIYGVQNWWSEWSQTTILRSWTLSFSAWYWPLYMVSMQNWHFWRSEKSSIQCHISAFCGPWTTHRLIPDHSFHCIQITSNKANGHKSHCSELISGTKGLQFVTFWKLFSLTENAGEHRSKGIDHIYGVQNWCSEWSQTTIVHSWT